jgi:hypothetical protein
MGEPEAEEPTQPEDAPTRLRKNLRRVEVMYGLMLKLIWEIGAELDGSDERERLREILGQWLVGSDANLGMILAEETAFDEPWLRCSNCDTVQAFSECFEGYLEDADRFTCKACDHSWVAPQSAIG